jgi:hypothetical protein
LHISILAQKLIHSLIVLDTTTGNIIKQSSEWDYRGADMFGGPDKVGGFFFQRGFLVFDTYTGELFKYPNADPYFIDLAYWVAAPEGFSGESACGKP